MKNSVVLFFAAAVLVCGLPEQGESGLVGSIRFVSWVLFLISVRVTGED